MPEVLKREYNPLITGFSGSKGPLNISLTAAKRIFGEFPSKYGFVSAKKGKTNQARTEHRALNLEVGRLIKKILADPRRSLKRRVHRFFKDWHRDLKDEFRVDIRPFFNMNDALKLSRLLKENEGDLLRYATMDIKGLLADSRLIRKDILNSIDPDRLVSKASAIIAKKSRDLDGRMMETATSVLTDLNGYILINRLKRFTGDDLTSPRADAVDSYTDEISALLRQFHLHRPIAGIRAISGRTGEGIEFEYAARDVSYLDLGKRTGDCTADKRGFQSDSTIENIFWTVFSWILDRNYQIVKVFFDNEFIMKVHLLPLYVTGSNDDGIRRVASLARSDYIVLAVDAIETTLAFRDDQPSFAKDHLFQHKEEIFSETMDFIVHLADAMNIHPVYAEEFSNTPWVRKALGAYPEVFLHVDHLFKIDQLEDVYCLAEEISTQMGLHPPKEVFMELQMKNTYLSPGYMHKAPGIKSFALIRGDTADGIPMNKIVGV